MSVTQYIKRFVRWTAGTALLVVLSAAMDPTGTQLVAAQTIVTGVVVDASDQEPLGGANVSALRLRDSTVTGVAADAQGAFRLSLTPGTYRLRISFVGYATDERRLTMASDSLHLGQIELRAIPGLLDEVVVEEMQERVVLRGDTTVYNAAAYRVNPDASVEDLIRKMPGIVVQDGTVQAEGEAVRRVLVDGEEFFGDDPSAALKNLPAEIVDEIEVYDRRSDQAAFTGFDDGNEERTINVVTRPDRRRGQFGNLFGGYGSDARYRTGGSVNIFAGPRRISIIGLSNNVNQQNFSRDDLTGLLDGGSGGRRGGGSPGRGGGATAARAFMVGEQGGINTTNSLGLNYIDRWGERIRVNGSYFLSHSRNTTDSELEREYFEAEGDNRLYRETNDGRSSNANHRLSMRVEATLSDRTELVVTPRIRIQQNSSTDDRSSLSALASGLSLSSNASRNTRESLGLSGSTNVVLRHRLTKRGRTLSANLGVGLDGRQSDSDQDVRSTFYYTGVSDADSIDAFLRRIDSDRGSRDASLNLAYTEPIGEHGMLQLTYSPSRSIHDADQGAFRFDERTGAYTLVDSANTRESDQQIIQHRGGIDFRYRTERLRLSGGLELQSERVLYEQFGPRAFEVDRSYLTFLPTARFDLELSDAASVNVSYRVRTTTPGAHQLADVIDDSNPLLITSGNPELRTSTAHRIGARFRSTNRESGRFFMASANLTATHDYVGTASFTAEQDTPLEQGVILPRGGRFSYPVNLDGQWRASSYLTLGRPIQTIKSNVNASGGVSFSRTPRLIEGIMGTSDALGVHGNVFLGSNISERLDFSLSYGLNYSVVGGTDVGRSGDSHVRHDGTVQLNALPWRGLSLQSSLRLAHFSGLSAEIDPTTVYWDLGLGYKFLRDDLAEVRLTVSDLLNQGASVDRNVSDLYVEDLQSQVLGRYLMLNLIYKLRHFGI